MELSAICWEGVAEVGSCQPAAGPERNPAASSDQGSRLPSAGRTILNASNGSARPGSNLSCCAALATTLPASKPFAAGARRPHSAPPFRGPLAAFVETVASLSPDAAGAFVDTPTVGPNETITARFVEDNPGRWLYHCHVFAHQDGGMAGWYMASP